MLGRTGAAARAKKSAASSDGEQREQLLRDARRRLRDAEMMQYKIFQHLSSQQLCASTTPRSVVAHPARGRWTVQSTGWHKVEMRQDRVRVQMRSGRDANGCSAIAAQYLANIGSARGWRW